MHAVILAGGKGTRLRPYTTVLPKPLMPIGEMPILEIVLRQLKANGFSRITIAVGYLSEILKAFFGDGSRLGLKIDYSLEEKPLGTAAPLKLIEELPDTFIMMNGDLLTNISYKEFLNFHLESQSLMSIATYLREVKIDFGVLEADQNNRLLQYVEKPTMDYMVSMGIYAFQKEVLSYIPDNKYFDLPDLVKLLLDKGDPLSTYRFSGYWLDIGRPDDYSLAVDEFESKKSFFLPEIEG